MFTHERLSKILQALEYTPTELAEGIGCTKKRAEKIISGTATIYWDDACDICDYIGINVASLFRDGKVVSA